MLLLVRNESLAFYTFTRILFPLAFAVPGWHYGPKFAACLDSSELLFMYAAMDNNGTHNAES